MTRPSRCRFHSNCLTVPKNCAYTAAQVKACIDQDECNGFHIQLPTAVKGKTPYVRVAMTPSAMRLYKDRWNACEKEWTKKGDPRADRMTPIRQVKSGSLEEWRTSGVYFVVEETLS